MSSARNEVSGSGSFEEEGNQEEAWRDPPKEQGGSTLSSFYGEAECNSSLSSDDSVCIGGYTMEEAKKDVKRTWARPITKRHSSISRFQYLEVSKEMDKVTDQFADLLAHPSQDVTPNKSLEVEKCNNSEFLHKLERAINEPISGHTSYNTVFDQTNMDNSSDDQKQAPCKDDSIICISDDSLSQLYTSGYEYVDEESTSPVMTYMKEEGQQLIREAINDDDSFMSAVQTSFVNKVEADKVVPRLKLDFTHLSGISEKTEFTASEFVSFSSNSEASSNIPKIKVNDGTGSSYEDISGSFITEASESQITAPLSVKNDSYTTESSEDKFASSTSPQSDLSSSGRQKNDSINFDDTLEEMNRFLAQGCDYVMPEKTTPSKNTTQEQKTIFSSISGSFQNDREGEFPYLESKQQHRKFHSAEKVSVPKPTLGPSKSATKPKYISKLKPPFVTTKNVGKAADPIFKIPNKPMKTPNKVNPILKNVVSPVGVYIKHTPKVCPMRNAPPLIKSKLPLSKTSHSAPTLSQKENIPVSLDSEDIPGVIYKPAKKQIATEVRKVNLPNSINKLVTPQVVTKHEGRTDYCNQSIERRLMESDYSINQSDLDSTAGDVSILTHNQPFNLKKF